VVSEVQLAEVQEMTRADLLNRRRRGQFGPQNQAGSIEYLLV
jgi:hypothetical protein